MKPYEQRLVQEAGGLSIRLEKLSAFIKSQKFHDLLGGDRDLLLRQERVMSKYHGILLRRIDRIEL